MAISINIISIASRNESEIKEFYIKMKKKRKSLLLEETVDVECKIQYGNKI
jgi:hypothetical protein